MYEKELARKATARFSEGGMDLIRFTNSGTEANTTVLGAAIAWTGGRKKVFVLSNGYHGSAIISPTDLCRWIHFQLSNLPPFTSMNLPRDFVVAAFNNLAQAKAIVHALPKDSLAAIMVEPVQGAAGFRPALPEFMKYLRETQMIWVLCFSLTRS